mmetsp:Transcript_41346/g.36698  ORF Transcript_41346/g.36698 Transcript_41346/m.36698 type:complete len:248 (-) Transcript_41346:449-1192(-)
MLEQFLVFTSSFFSFFSFFISGFSVSLFHGSLSSKIINLRLSVLSFFLQISKPHDFSFLFILYTLLLGLVFGILTSLFNIIFYDLLFLKLFLVNLGLLSRNSLKICFINFILSQLLLMLSIKVSLSFFLLQLLDELNDLLTFSLLLFLGSQSLEFSFLDLVNNDTSTSNKLFLLFLFKLFVVFDLLESIDFKHEILSLFFDFLLLSDILLLVKLSVSDSGDLGIQNKLVHVLNFISLLIHDFFSSIS